MTLFGRPGTKLDKDGNPIPESFHKYPMRQAIEEGYILDVLLGYMPYRTAYRLKEDVVPENVVDERAAIRTIAHWQSMHPTNVMSKAEFIVEHFVKNVAKLLDGQAKAMVVTFSRASVIRYKYAIDAYLKAHPQYDKDKIEKRLQFTVPGEPLVAFSRKVKGEDAIMPEDTHIVDEFTYLKENPFAYIKRDFEYTEDNMNNIGYQKIETAFDKPESRMLIADGRMESIIRLAAIALKNNEFGDLADRIINDPQAWYPLAEIIYDLVDKNKRIDMPDLMKLMSEGNGKD